MKVSFIGSGNIATHLATAANLAAIDIINIYSKNFDNAKSLASICNAKAVDNIHDIENNIDLLILAVNDDAIEQIATDLKNISCPVVHTAGSININVLASDAHAHGVIYPLQTFSKNKAIDLSKVPFFIESSDPSVKMILEELCTKLGLSYQIVSSEQRLNLHIAAVFASNFTNAMYSIAKDLLDKQGLDFDNLLPLILETAHKLESMEPGAAQTGPAKRNDQVTISKHLEALASEPQIQALYQAISEHIQKNQ